MITAMDNLHAREFLDRLIHERRENYGALSKLIGRNAAYIQQYIKRGSPKKLDESDRKILARYFGVDEHLLGGPEEAPARISNRGAKNLVLVPQYDLGASAGAGSLDQSERPAGRMAFDEKWIRELGASPTGLSMIRVDGDSMAPTLSHGDDILVDRLDGFPQLRDGIYVLRLDDALMVKRVAIGPVKGRFSVLSDNPHYPDWEDIDPALVNVIGRVLWTGRKVG
ncbi:S24 family peptidase [Rhizorhapis suberifaciens]|uniref:Phage repressor protein C with HTH and peptisase S24 domain n=1 Tax=Rhizorhapis suberifaciens TaxID=13656 RepID=A0A840HTI0_9SPHN|nr:S24/S26 family peptidase [Rhizorhapis suberifaciens]MBB4640917.1 phage repressor protein C with HTH and peptisase S24 domain [Rhizorhapis suberifaciens]